MFWSMSVTWGSLGRNSSRSWGRKHTRIWLLPFTLQLSWAQENLNTRNCTCNCSDVDGHAVSSCHLPLHRQRFTYLDRDQIQLDIAYPIAKSKHKQTDGRACCVCNPEYPNSTQKHTHEREAETERKRQRRRERNKRAWEWEKKVDLISCCVQTGVRCGEWSPGAHTQQCLLGSMVVWSRFLQLSSCGIAVSRCMQLRQAKNCMGVLQGRIE